MQPVGFGAAFLAGLASFLSPCVLPLVPGYLSFMTGLSLEELSSEADRGRVMRRASLASLCFVLGFSLVFTALGASASFIGRLLAAHLDLMAKAAGVLIIAFGLHITGLVPIKWLYYHKKADTSGLPPGLLSSFLIGVAFAFGWTPCIGPILAAILALAATQQSVMQGVALLFVYSLGLGVPFLLTGLGVNVFLRFFASYKRYIRYGEVAAGVLLVVIGLLVMTNNLTWFMRFLPRAFYKFSM